MERSKAYYIGLHPHHFRMGVPAEIIGVEIVVPTGGFPPRLCYHLQWSDLKEDWRPVADSDSYKVVDFKEVISGKYKVK